MFEKLRRNIKPLIGSILIAMILWFLVATDKEYSYQIKTPLHILRLAQGKTLREKIPAHAVLEIRGKGRALIAIWFYDIKFNLELPEIKSDQTITLADYLNFLDLPATLGIQVLEIIEPTSLKLKVDDIIITEKPVRLSGDIGTADGYVLLKYDFDNDSVEVTGAKTLLRGIPYIMTDTLEIINQKARLINKVALKNPYPDLIEITPREVNVTIDIQRLGERTINQIPINIINVPPYLEVEANPQEIRFLRIKGGVDLLADIQPTDIKAEIDFKNYRPDQEEYSARIVTPENINWLEADPKTFNLKVKRK
jgi:hypothetical protein